MTGATHDAKQFFFAEIKPFISSSIITRTNMIFKNKKFMLDEMHTEVKYSIAGEEFQAAKQFILSSDCICPDGVMV